MSEGVLAQAPGDYAKPNNPKDSENDAFLVPRGHHGKEILYYCDSEKEEKSDLGGSEGFG